MDGRSSQVAAERGETSQVERARRGDRDAFAAIVDDRIEATFRDTLAILGEETLALDATRAIFTRTWRELPRLDKPDRFPAWFGGLVVQGCRAAGGDKKPRRRRGPRGGARVREIEVAPAYDAYRPPTAAGAADRPAASGDQDRVSRALDRLPVTTRTLLYLHYDAHLSAETIGERTASPARATWSRLFDARRSLERALQAEPSTDPGDALTDEAIGAAFERRSSRPCPRGLRLEVFTEAGAIHQLSGWGPLSVLRSPAVVRIGAAGAAAIGLAALIAVGVSQIPQASVSPSPTQVVQAGLLAFVRDGDVYLGNSAGGDATRAAHADGVPFRSVAWSPDGHTLVVASDQALFVVDPADLAIRRLASGQLAAWAPDSTRVAVIDPSSERPDGSNVIRIVRVTDGATLSELPTPAHSSMQPPMAWSPDGHWLVGTANGRLLRFDLRSGLSAEIAKLLDVGSQSAGLAWSPDSRRLAYIDVENPEGADYCHRNCTGRLTIIDPDGGNTSQPVIDTPSQSKPAWSPDGRSIAFLADDTLRSEGGSLTVIDLPDRSVRTVAAGPIGAFAWRPGGGSIAFERRVGDRGSVWTLSSVPIEPAADRNESPMPSGTGSPSPDVTEPPLEETVLVPERADSGFGWQPLAVGASAVRPPEPTAPPVAATPEPVRIPEPAKLGDVTGSGSALVFDAYHDPDAGDCLEALRTPSNGGESSVVRSFCGVSFNSGQWSPDGSSYVALVDDRLELTKLDRTTRVIASGLIAADSPTWSPDGRRLAIHQCPNGIQCVWVVMRPDGTDREQLTGEPSWSPNGAHRMVREPDGTTVVAGQDGHAPAYLMSDPVPPGGKLSPDGNQIAVVQDGDVWLKSVSGLDSVNLTNFAFGGALDAIWSPDGRSIAVPRDGELWIVPARGGASRGTIAERGAWMGSVRWSPDSSRLAVEVWESQTGTSAIRIISSNGAPTVTLASAQAPLWSPDGRFLAFAVTSDGSSSGLAVANADGSGQTKVWDGIGNNLPQAWAP